MWSQGPGVNRTASRGWGQAGVPGSGTQAPGEDSGLSESCCHLTLPPPSSLSPLHLGTAMTTVFFQNSLCICRSYAHRHIPSRQPTPAFLPGELHGQRSLAATVYGAARVGHDWATSTQCRQWHGTRLFTACSFHFRLMLGVAPSPLTQSCRPFFPAAECSPRGSPL